MKAVLLDKKNFLADFEIKDLDLQWQEYDITTTKEEVVSRLSDAEIAVSHGVYYDRETLQKLPNLKMITLNCTGYERIDTETCKKMGITVCNITDWCTNAVAEHILSFIFSLNRLQPSYHQFVQNGSWRATPYELAYRPAKEIRGSVLGLIGNGTIGKHLADICKGLGMNVLIAEHRNSNSVRQGYTPFDEVIKQSDFIVLQAPLSKQTFHMISYPELEMMPSDAYLINCGRGGLVNEKALLEALEQKKIEGAALDVLEADSFENGGLFNYSGHNLILSSHIAFASRQSIANNTAMVLENIRQFINGTPVNVVS